MLKKDPVTSDEATPVPSGVTFKLLMVPAWLSLFDSAMFAKLSSCVNGLAVFMGDTCVVSRKLQNFPLPGRTHTEVQSSLRLTPPLLPARTCLQLAWT